ncbi:kinase-like protein, partial [Neoconidiobolus thromboides FSU 785]
VYKRLYQGKVVAEKNLKENISDAKALGAMRKQIAILKRLAVCPYIIQFIGVCIKGNKVGLITQYAEKGNLKDLLESTQRLDKELRYRFMVDVVEGVAFLHEMGVLHKNLKTSCILITEEFKAKISGFEFSREVQEGTSLALDEGSDRYRWIPPEKIQDYFEYTNKSDIYSLGMILWSIWSRRYPYEIMSQQAIEDLVSRGGREDITQVPSEIRPIILGCWQQDPMERPDASDI